MQDQFGGRDERPFHVVTPVLESIALSEAAGTKVYMKMENVQPAGSFKIRGIGNFCQQVARKGCQHLVCSSGGNAGLAAAYVAQKLGIPATIVIPGSAPLSTLKKLKKFGAEVEIFGKVWDDADERAKRLAETDGWFRIHPFDHPLVWKGHSTMIEELRDSLDTKPGAIVLSVGGGGLLCGVVSGLQEVGWQDVPIIAVETRGADSFNAALKAGRLVTLPDITRYTMKTAVDLPGERHCGEGPVLVLPPSGPLVEEVHKKELQKMISGVAKCLGAKTVAQRALDCARECCIVSHVLDDVEAVKAVEQFLDDERMLVEPSCAATLAFLYSGYLQQLQEEGRLSRQLGSVVAIVCGGSAIHAEELRALKNQLGMK